jgi:phosphotransferase system HPr-like phosphotransfer protein
MTKTMKEINTAPAVKIKKPMNIMKREKTVERPAVSFPSTIKDIPKPILSLNNNRKRVDATDNVRLMMARLV